ncbi:MAG: TraB/GumN family protein [Candidatus Hodarchaeota archaeon]
MHEERLVIVGVVHGQKSCIEEIESVIEREKPEIVAIELPPTFQDASLKGLDAYINSFTMNYKQLFENLELMGLPREYSSGLEAVALGLSLQGVEFLAAIKAARKNQARVEFIDVARDKLFWKLLVETLKEMTREGQQVISPIDSEIEIFPGFNLPSFKIPTLKGISTVIFNTLNEWKKSLNDLMNIYSEPDYENLIKKISPIVDKMNEYPVFKEILVEYRNKFMATKLIELLKSSLGKIVFITGYGHVAGIRGLVKKELE